MRASLALTAALAAAGGAAQAEEDARFTLGREVFLERAEPACPICHALAEAGAAGAVGPDLDTLRPDAEQVRRAVTQGIGPMQPYEGLSDEEVDALAQYVAIVTGGGDGR
jgi:cytochrome c6